MTARVTLSARHATPPPPYSRYPKPAVHIAMYTDPDDSDDDNDDDDDDVETPSHDGALGFNTRNLRNSLDIQWRCPRRREKKGPLRRMLCGLRRRLCGESGAAVRMPGGI